MLFFLVFFGTAAVAGILAGGAAYLVVRRIGVAVLAGGAAAATWVLFIFDWLVYSIGEYQEFDRASPYARYRDALEGWTGVEIGVGYALLAGAAVILGAVLIRGWGPGWAVVSVPLAAGAVGLPLIVPAQLSQGAPEPVELPSASAPPTRQARPRPKPPAPAPVGLPPPRTPLSDRRTQASLLGLARRMRDCRRRSGTYVACSGRRDVRSLSRSSFTVAAYSQRGVLYAVTERARTCRPRGEGRCPATGTW